jgi:hypothetical protein
VLRGAYHAYEALGISLPGFHASSFGRHVTALLRMALETHVRICAGGTLDLAVYAHLQCGTVDGMSVTLTCDPFRSAHSTISNALQSEPSSLATAIGPLSLNSNDTFAIMHRNVEDDMFLKCRLHTRDEHQRKSLPQAVLLDPWIQMRSKAEVVIDHRLVTKFRLVSLPVRRRHSTHRPPPHPQSLTPPTLPRHLALPVMFWPYP